MHCCLPLRCTASSGSLAGFARSFLSCYFSLDQIARCAEGGHHHAQNHEGQGCWWFCLHLVRPRPPPVPRPVLRGFLPSLPPGCAIRQAARACPCLLSDLLCLRACSLFYDLTPDIMLHSHELLAAVPRMTAFVAQTACCAFRCLLCVLAQFLRLISLSWLVPCR